MAIVKLLVQLGLDRRRLVLLGVLVFELFDLVHQPAILSDRQRGFLKDRHSLRHCVEPPCFN
jgi:hypothetical protein